MKPPALEQAEIWCHQSFQAVFGEMLALLLGIVPFATAHSTSHGLAPRCCSKHTPTQLHLVLYKWR